MFQFPVKVAVMGTLSLLAVVLIIEIREAFRRLNGRR